MEDQRPLSSFASVIGRGIAPRYAVDGNVTVLNQKCVRDGSVSFSAARRHDGASRPVPVSKRLLPGDSLINSTGRGTLGRTGWVRGPVGETTVDSHITIVRPNFDTNSRWLAYALRMRESFIEDLAIGSTGQTELPREALGALPIPNRSSVEQEAIAEVLGALDDKIAANLTLADVALELVDRLFPRAHDGAPRRLGEVVAVTKGNSYKSADLAPSDRALVSLKSITRDGRYSRDGMKPFTGSFKPQQVIAPNEIVVAQTDLTQAADVVGRAVRVPAEPNLTLVASLDLAIVRPIRGIDPTYLLGLLRQPDFREHCRSNTTGTTVLHLRSGAIESFAARVADASIQEAYAREVLPILRAADLAAWENRILAATRDALLPQLMSGKLRVREAAAAVSGLGV